MFFKNIDLIEQERALLEVRTPLIVKSLNLMGYDAANLGWMDLYLQPDILARAADLARFPFVSANLRDDSGEAPFAPWVIREFEGFSVGIFGLVSRSAPPQAGGIRKHYQVTDPVQAARDAVAGLRGRCDLVVALTSLGLDDDAELAREVPGIDVILGGLTRRTLYEPRLVGETIIVQAGAKGMRIGSLELALIPGRGGPWVASAKAGGDEARIFTWKPVQLAKAIPDHPGVTALLEEYRHTLKAEEVARKVAPREAPPSRSLYQGAAACRECHDRETAQWAATPHAAAFKILVRKNQDGNPDCLECHVTGYGKGGGYSPGGTPDLTGVQCEACHGPARSHRGPGGIGARVAEEVCRGCHNSENSPTFRYEEYMRKLGGHADSYFRRPPALR